MTKVWYDHPKSDIKTKNFISALFINVQKYFQDQDAISLNVTTTIATMNPPIPEDLIKKWSLQMAKDLKFWLDTEYRPDLEWNVTAGASGAQYEPPNQVTENIRMGFSFGAKYKGRPDFVVSIPNIKNDFSIKKISKRVIKKCPK